MIKVTAKGLLLPICTGRDLGHRKQEAGKTVNMRPASKGIDSVVLRFARDFANLGTDGPILQDTPDLLELWQETGAIRARKAE